jgi:serine/threonine-protein kinase ULK2
MYMMMVRKPPFRGDDEHEVMQNILSTEPIFTKDIKNRYSESCIDFLKNLLIKNPIKRMSVEQAYDHPWIQKKRDASSWE